MNKIVALQEAITLADLEAAPVLVMRLGDTYTYGLRTSRSTREFGDHVATVHRYGRICFDTCIKHLADHNHICLCQ